MTTACDSPDAAPLEQAPLHRAAQQSSAPADPGDPDRLDVTPYLLDLDEDTNVWLETIDLAGVNEETTVTVYAHAVEQPAEVKMFDTDAGEQLAEGEFIGEIEIEEDGGGSTPIFVTELAIDASAVRKALLDFRIEPLPRPDIFLCHETVRNTDDSGPESLRQALADVQDGGSVCFSPQVFASGHPIELLSEIVVSKNVTILGSTAGSVTVKAQGNHRIFNFKNDRDVVLRDLVLIDGRALEGGLVRSDGTLSTHGCGFVEGRAYQGGAIYSDDTVFLRGSSVRDNFAFDGGGVYCDDCNLYVDDTTVADNEADRGGGIFGHRSSVTVRNGARVLNNKAYQGGGFYSDSPGAITGFNDIDGGTLAGNIADQGGGAYLDGGQMRLNRDDPGPGTSASVSANLAREGGGLYVGPDTQLEIRNDASVVLNGAQGNGGGIYNLGNIVMTQTARIADNNADGQGGGIYTPGDLRLAPTNAVKGNHASGGGGGVAWSGIAILPNGTVFGNTPNDSILLP